MQQVGNSLTKSSLLLALLTVPFAVPTGLDARLFAAAAGRRLTGRLSGGILFAGLAIAGRLLPGLPASESLLDVIAAAADLVDLTLLNRRRPKIVLLGLPFRFNLFMQSRSRRQFLLDLQLLLRGFLLLGSGNVLLVWFLVGKVTALAHDHLAASIRRDGKCGRLGQIELALDQAVIFVTELALDIGWFWLLVLMVLERGSSGAPQVHIWRWWMDDAVQARVRVVHVVPLGKQGGGVGRTADRLDDLAVVEDALDLVLGGGGRWKGLKNN